MRDKVILTLNSLGASQRSVQELFKSAGLEPTEAQLKGPLDLYTIELALEAPELQRLRDELRQRDLPWFERRVREYAAEELQRAPLLVMTLGQRPQGQGGPRYGTKYDLSTAYDQCGTGALQTSRLRLKGKELPRGAKMFQTLSREVLVCQEIADSLAEFPALELRRAEDADSDQELPWFQLLPQVQLGPMHPSTKGITRANPCQGCGRDGYFGDTKQPLEIVYSRDDLPEAASDVMWTHEYFGNSVLHEPFEESSLAQPMFIVSPGAMSTLKGHGIKTLTFEPVSVR